MLTRIYHWLSGYVEFLVKGDGARLFTMAAKRGLLLWGFRREGGAAGARIRPGEYRRLRPLCRRCGAVCRVGKMRGLPFQLARLWARKGLIIGAVLGAALYWHMSGFVWGVSVSGTEKLPPNQVLDAARDSGVYVGARREYLRAGNPEGRIQTLLPRLSWVSVNTDGCFADVAVKEGVAKPEREQTGELSNIVAARAGRIVKLEAHEGRPEVEPGETVFEGQLLIAGLYQERLDPWAPPPPEPYERTGAARGSVTAETYREFTVQVGGTKTLERETGRGSELWLRAFGAEIPLGLFGKPQGPVRSWEEAWQWEVLGVKLPLGLRRQTTVYLEEQERPLSEEEQKAAALRKLREVQKAQLPQGSSVKKEELEFTFSDGLCILSAKCRCWEEIGVLEKILVE